MLDHGTGIVIGETAAIGDNCSLLQGVTLGGTGKETGDRHPKIGANVMIGAGAKVLGNIKVGDCSRVAAGSVVLKDVPPRDDGGRRAGQGGRARRLPRARAHHGPAACCPTIAAAAELRRARRIVEPARNGARAGLSAQGVRRQDAVGARAPEDQGLGRGLCRRRLRRHADRDDEDGELCYQFQMAILELDLEEM